MVTFRFRGRFVRSDGHPFIWRLGLAGLVHAQFGTIHPFMDGNGRTGRALVHVVLRRRGLAPSYVPPVSVILAADRSGYSRGLTAFRQGDIDGWLMRFSVATARAAGLAGDYLDAVEELRVQRHGPSFLTAV